ncbi:GNAT family N-acetyltransferase [Haladaptatus sp. DYSN1]|uniref:GNAT family N-acetyltransferase n=1 Tax=unclassified Haladaptatus TaxID=2622732 RepID=UPI002405F06D|nr:GNAT family protein [Haladaptatus sp. DYSN1]
MPGARVASGERVTLRTAEAEDIPFLQRGAANPEIRYPLGNPVKNQGQYEISASRTGPDTFIVCLEVEEAEAEAETITRIGQVSVMDAHYKRPELGYWLVPEVHGEGYGKEAVSLVIDYAFRSYDTPAIGAEAFDYNDASRGLLESLGFTEEGCRRKFMFVDGEHRDMVQYGLLREEWELEE